MSVGPCCFCERPVEARHAAYPVTGWETARTGGGANRILGRKRTPGLVAHTRCVEEKLRAEERGLVGQEQLL